MVQCVESGSQLTVHARATTGGEVATSALAAAGDEAVLVAGNAPAGVWARLVWLSDSKTAELPEPSGWAPRAVDGGAVALVRAAFSARDLSSKKAVKKTLRWGMTIFFILLLGGGLELACQPCIRQGTQWAA